MKKIILLGAGDHAKVLIEAIMAMKKYEILGLLDVAPSAAGKILGYPLLGGDDYLQKISPSDVSLVLGVGCVKATILRKTIFEKFSPRFDFPAVIHPSAEISRWTTMGKGVQIMSAAVIHPVVTLGDNALINTGAIVEHDCLIGAHTHVSVRAVLGGKVTVGECAHIGMGAVVLQGITIGNFVTVGAGAVVTEDVPDGKTVAGIPARNI